MRSIFFKGGKSNFFYQTWTEITEIIFSTLCKKFKIFPFILFEKDDWPKAYADPRLPTLPYSQIWLIMRIIFCVESLHVIEIGLY